MPGDEFLSREEAAQELGYSSKTLANWASKGIGPKSYRGNPDVPRTGSNRAKYLRSDIERFKARRLEDA
jgi:predicted DNA-binding transcriptional regulator AlpA